MSKLDEFQFKKISKYSLRIKKSIFKKNNKKIQEYYDHLKYHIQKGGSSEQLKNKFENLDNLIKNITYSKGYQTYDNLIQDLNKCNNDKNDLSEKNIELQSRLNYALSDLPQISKKEMLKNEKTTSLNEQIDMLNEKIKLLQHNEQEQEKVIEEKNKIDEEKDNIIRDKTNDIKKISELLENIYEHSNIIGDDIEKKTSELNNKIEKYNKIIDIINDKIVTFKDDIESFEFENFNNALDTLKQKLSNAEQNNLLLDEIKMENISIKNKLKEHENVIKQSNELKEIILSKNNEIEELKNKILILEKENKENEEKINKISIEFENKLRELLIQIYGNNDLVDDIIDGNSFGKGKYRI